MRVTPGLGALELHALAMTGTRQNQTVKLNVINPANQVWRSTAVLRYAK